MGIGISGGSSAATSASHCLPSLTTPSICEKEEVDLQETGWQVLFLPFFPLENGRMQAFLFSNLKAEKEGKLQPLNLSHSPTEKMGETEKEQLSSPLMAAALPIPT